MKNAAAAAHHATPCQLVAPSALPTAPHGNTVHIFLTKGMLVKVGGPITMQVNSGRVWATHTVRAKQGRAQDLFLGSGETLRIEVGCEALVEPGEDAQLALVQPVSRTFAVAGSTTLSLGGLFMQAWRSVRLRPTMAAQLS
jgi:hypothetical protein